MEIEETLIKKQELQSLFLIFIENDNDCEYFNELTALKRLQYQFNEKHNNFYAHSFGIFCNFLCSFKCFWQVNVVLPDIIYYICDSSFENSLTS